MLEKLIFYIYFEN